MMPPRLRIATGVGGCQAIDQRMKQFLFERSRDFWIRDQLAFRFGEPTGS
jgi:hypothetical protein